MPENPTFVVNDRRKFTADGDLRSAGDHADVSKGASTAKSADASLKRQSSAPETSAEAESNDVPQVPEADRPIQNVKVDSEPNKTMGRDEKDRVQGLDTGTEIPPAPTAEQSAEITRAYNSTIERLDTAMRAADPGGERMPEMTFERLVQSLYTQALLLLGGAIEPGQTPRVDILGARQTIDMLAIIEARSKGNLSGAEDELLQTALFDLRMGFLELTQALAQQAALRKADTPSGLFQAGKMQLVK